MIRLRPHYSWESLLTMYPDPLADGNDVVVPADAAEMQKSIFADEVDDETDLIHMCGKHDPRGSVRVYNGRNVPHYIACHEVCETLRVFSIDSACRRFGAAGGGSLGQCSEQIDGNQFHASNTAPLMLVYLCTRRRSA